MKPGSSPRFVVPAVFPLALLAYASPLALAACGFTLAACGFTLAACGFTLAACGGASKEPAVPAAEAAPASSASATAAAATPPGAAVASGSAYRGHGVESVEAGALERFRPRPLPPAVAASVQRYIDVRNLDRGFVSSDGRVLFVEWNVTGTPQVWRIDGARRFPVQLTGGSEVTGIQAITPDGKLLVVSRDRNGEENPGLYVLPAAGGALELIQHVPGVQTEFQVLSKDGRYVYFRSNEKRKDAYSIWRYDLTTKQKELVFEGNAIFALADVADDGRLLLDKQTGGSSDEIYELDPRTKQLTPLLGQNETEQYEVKYGADPGDVIVRTNKPSEFIRLYVLRKGKLVPISEELKADVASFDVVRGKTPRIVFTVNDGGYRRHRAIDARSWKALRVPEIPSAQSVVWRHSTEDGRFSVLSVDDGRGPVTVWVHDWNTGKPESWVVPSSPELDAAKYARAELEYYPARDGTQIPAFVRRSDACKKELCPVLVNFHGGPEGQSLPGFAPALQVYVDAGYVVVEPNVRGSIGYGKKWFHADDGPKRLGVITDIEDAGKWAREHFSVGGKAPKVGVMGGSYGGYSTLVAMTMFAGTYDAGVSNVGMASLLTFLQNTAPYRRILRASEYGDPDKDREALVKLSPVTYVDRIKAPLFVIQGATDPRVPAGEAIQMYEKIKDKGVPADLMIFADEGHGAKKRENRVLTLGHTLAFFDKHLKGKE